MTNVDALSHYESTLHNGNGSTLTNVFDHHKESISQADCVLSYSNQDLIVPSRTSTSFGLSPTSSNSSRADTPGVNGSQSTSSYLSRKAKRISRIYSDHSSFDRFQALEVEPALVDYLVVHGALSKSISKQILNADRHHGRSLLLASLGLPSSEAMQPSAQSYSFSFSTGFALLLNALRHTGHHSLANYLDCGRRITPLSCVNHGLPTIQGDLNGFVSRRRGQLSVWIRLEAIKVNPSSYHEFRLQLNGTGTPDSANWSNTQLSSKTLTNGLRPTCVPVLPSFVEYLQLDKTPGRPISEDAEQAVAPTSSLWIDLVSSLITPATSPELIDPSEPLPETKNPHRSIGCLAKLRSLLYCTRKSKKRTKRSTNHSLPQSAPKTSVGDSTVVPAKGPSDKLPFVGSGDHVTSTEDAAIKTTKTTKLELFNKKSGEFYSTLLDSTSALHDSIVRYFEQVCEVLVLGNRLTTYPMEKGDELKLKNADLVVQILVVATRSDLVHRLSDACKSNQYQELDITVTQTVAFSTCRLANELRQVVIQSGVLTFLKLQDLRLSAGIDSKEVLLAVEELNDLVE